MRTRLQGCSLGLDAFARGGLIMAIRALLEHDHAFDPDEAAVLVCAFQEACRSLGLAERDDAATLLVAKAIIDLAKCGERDANCLRDAAIKALTIGS